MPALDRRLSALEASHQRSGPYFLFTTEDEARQPVTIEVDGNVLVRGDGETPQAFVDRAKTRALNGRAGYVVLCNAFDLAL